MESHGAINCQPDKWLKNKITLINILIIIKMSKVVRLSQRVEEAEEQFAIDKKNLYTKNKERLLAAARKRYSEMTDEQKAAKIEYNRQWRIKNREAHQASWTKSNAKNLKHCYKQKYVLVSEL